MLTVLVFFVILGLLIFVHEFGHFFAAKRSGAAVDEFGFGFPPRIWGFRHKETLYSINAIPLGGFVKVRGEDSRTMEPGTFAALSIGRRAWVLVNGVLMNIVLAYVLFTVGFLIGTPTTLSDDIPPGANVTERNLYIESVIMNSAAERAGILPGDIIQQIDRLPVTSLSEVQAYNSARAGSSESLRIKRDGNVVMVTVTPQVLPDSGGKAVWGVELVEGGILRFPIHLALYHGITATGTLFWNILNAFGDLIRQIFTTRSVSDDITGPIGIAVLTGRVVDLGIFHLIQFTALLSLNLALINILPFPALDGGRLLFLVIELFTRKRVSAKIERVVHSTGFALLLLLIAFITFRDINRFGGIIQKFFQGFTI